MLSPVPSHLAKYPCKAPSGVIHLSALSVRVTGTPRGCHKAHRWQINRSASLPASAYARTPSPQWKFSVRQCCVSINVTMVIQALGDTLWRFGSAISDGGGWIPIRRLTFPGRSSNGVISRGQESCAPGLFPRGIGELWAKGYSERKIKVEEHCTNHSGLELFEKIVLVVDKFVLLHLSFLKLRPWDPRQSYLAFHPVIKFLSHAVLNIEDKMAEQIILGTPTRGDVLVSLCFFNHVSFFSWALLRAYPSAHLASSNPNEKPLCVKWLFYGSWERTWARYIFDSEKQSRHYLLVYSFSGLDKCKGRLYHFLNTLFTVLIFSYLYSFRLIAWELWSYIGKYIYRNLWTLL